MLQPDLPPKKNQLKPKVLIYYDRFYYKHPGDILNLHTTALFIFASLLLCFFALLSSACHNMHPKGHQRMTNYFSAISNRAFNDVVKILGPTRGQEMVIFIPSFMSVSQNFWRHFRPTVCPDSS